MIPGAPYGGRHRTKGGYRRLPGGAAPGRPPCPAGGSAGCPRAAPARQNSYRRDARKIREELAEEIRVPGACCRDYETFRSIYRFLERGIIRSGQKSCVILLSLTDREGQIIPPEDKDRLMDRPGEDIRRTLRLGDLYTQYQPGQYLLLCPGCRQKDAPEVVERLGRRFRQENRGRYRLRCRVLEVKETPRRKK